MKRILPVIVISQFFCTSLWFAGNAVIIDISRQLHLTTTYVAYLTSTVQSGFIIGTLLFAILGIADRFSPVRVFFFCALAAAAINAGIVLPDVTISQVFIFRFLTGFFLAGIYPVGMKIASDHYQHGLGKSLGFLVGALVLGTAFPHFLKSLTTTLPWKYVIYATSALSVSGGTAMLLLVPDVSRLHPGSQFKLGDFLKSYTNKSFLAAALGYFGHMWELYAFWAFVPVMLTAYQKHYPAADLNIPFLSFLIIAAGSVSCAISGFLSLRMGAKKVAFMALALSCTCCIVSPVFLFVQSLPLLIVFLIFWSMVVIADSPQFSALVAQNAPPKSKGTALTLVNCIGFTITIISIQLIDLLRNDENSWYIYMALALGPVLGLIALSKTNAIKELT